MTMVSADFRVRAGVSHPPGVRSRLPAIKRDHVEQHITIERAKARTLRKSRWWQNRIAQNAQCYYCQGPLKAKEATMDHIIPLSQGGRSTPGNVVPCCKPCNNLKKNATAAHLLLDQIQKIQNP